MATIELDLETLRSLFIDRGGEAHVYSEHGLLIRKGDGEEVPGRMAELLRDAQLVYKAETSLLWRIALKNRNGYLLQNRSNKSQSLVAMFPGSGISTGLLEILPIGIIQVRKDFSVVAANNRAAILLGLKQEAFYDGNWIDQLPQRATSQLRSAVETAQPKPAPVQLTLEISGRPNTSRHLDVTINPDVRASLPDARFIITVLDRGAEYRIRNQLKVSAEHDPLTGLLNRGAFATAVNGLQERGITDLAMVFIDLDQFKAVNDTWGHAVGDELLNVAALRLKACARASDLVARLGGDEFAIAAINYPNDESLPLLGEKIARRLNHQVTIAGHQIDLKASVGVAHSQWCAESSESDDQCSERLMSYADEAMYVAKRSRATSFHVFQEDLLGKRATRNHQRAEYWRIQKNAAVFPVFQPIVGINGTVGVEALSRAHEELMYHPGGVEELIETAKHDSHGSQFLNMLCKLAIDAYGRWLADAPEFTAVKLNVNVDIVQLYQPGFVADLLSWIREAKVQSCNVCVEITETSLEDSVKLLTGPIKALKNAGLRLSIDDFGTGYASLHRLLELEFDQIKIDRVYISNALQDNKYRDVLRSIVALGRAASMEVLAEGVETEEQARFCRECGIDLLQGFIFHKPAALQELSDYIRAENHRQPEDLQILEHRK